MQKFKCEVPILKDKFKNHFILKDKLLSEINNQKNSNTSFGKDNIKKCDWSDSKNFERPWVKIINNDLKQQFLKFADYLSFKKFIMYELWYQQYSKEGEHGWHVHGHNYTGVYYLNYNKDCARTRLLDPYTKKYFTDIVADEGDIIIFPSTVIHTSQIQKTDFLKTIISFNVSFDNIKDVNYDNIDKEVKVIK